MNLDQIITAHHTNISPREKDQCLLERRRSSNSCSRAENSSVCAWVSWRSSQSSEHDVHSSHLHSLARPCVSIQVRGSSSSAASFVMHVHKLLTQAQMKLGFSKWMMDILYVSCLLKTYRWRCLIISKFYPLGYRPYLKSGGQSHSRCGWAQPGNKTSWLRLEKWLPITTRNILWNKELGWLIILRRQGKNWNYKVIPYNHTASEQLSKELSDHLSQMVCDPTKNICNCIHVSWINKFLPIWTLMKFDINNQHL